MNEQHDRLKHLMGELEKLRAIIQTINKEIESGELIPEPNQQQTIDYIGERGRAIFKEIEILTRSNLN